MSEAPVIQLPASYEIVSVKLADGHLHCAAFALHEAVLRDLIRSGKTFYCPSCGGAIHYDPNPI